MSDDIDYSKAPKSISEIKAFKAGCHKLWTVRDMLISALRDVDSAELNGVPVTGFIAIVTEGDDGSVYTTHYAAGPTKHAVAGAIECAKFNYMIASMQ